MLFLAIYHLFQLDYVTQILFANILPLFIYFLLLRHFEMQFYASFLQLKGEALGLWVSSI